MKCYVNVGSSGYIDNWSTIESEGLVQIDSGKNIFGMLDCVLVVDKVAKLDVERQKELQMESLPQSEMEQLKQENTLLKERCDATDNAVLELTDLILNGGE